MFTIDTITVRTGDRPVVHDLTSGGPPANEGVAGGGECAAFVHDAGSGLLNVFVPHATAGVAVLETGAGTDVDLLAVLDELLPRDDRYRHRHGSPGHGRDHVLPALVSPSVTVPVVDGRLRLGTWQSICLVDTNVDNPTRQVHLSLLS